MSQRKKNFFCYFKQFNGSLVGELKLFQVYHTIYKQEQIDQHFILLELDCFRPKQRVCSQGADISNHFVEC